MELGWVEKRWRGRAVYRGGNWNNGSNAGLFYINLNNAPGDSNNNIGFRCCSSHASQIPCFYGNREQSKCTGTSIHSQAEKTAE